MLSIYISVYSLRIFSIYIHISAAIRAIRKIPEDAVQREGGCVSCYSGNSGSRSALLFQEQRVMFCPVIPETAGHVLPCYSGDSGSRSVLLFRRQRVMFCPVTL